MSRRKGFNFPPRKEKVCFKRLSTYSEPHNVTAFAYDPVQAVLAVGTRNAEIHIFGRSNTQVVLYASPLTLCIDRLFLPRNKGLAVALCSLPSVESGDAKKSPVHGEETKGEGDGTGAGAEESESRTQYVCVWDLRIQRLVHSIRMARRIGLFCPTVEGTWALFTFRSAPNAIRFLHLPNAHLPSYVFGVPVPKSVPSTGPAPATGPTPASASAPATATATATTLALREDESFLAVGNRRGEVSVFDLVRERRDQRKQHRRVVSAVPVGFRKKTKIKIKIKSKSKVKRKGKGKKGKGKKSIKGKSRKSKSMVSAPTPTEADADADALSDSEDDGLSDDPDDPPIIVRPDDASRDVDADVDVDAADTKGQSSQSPSSLPKDVVSILRGITNAVPSLILRTPGESSPVRTIFWVSGSSKSEVASKAPRHLIVVYASARILIFRMPDKLPSSDKARCLPLAPLAALDGFSRMVRENDDLELASVGRLGPLSFVVGVRSKEAFRQALEDHMENDDDVSAGAFLDGVSDSDSDSDDSDDSENSEEEGEVTGADVDAKRRRQRKAKEDAKKDFGTIAAYARESRKKREKTKKRKKKKKKKGGGIFGWFKRRKNKKNKKKKGKKGKKGKAPKTPKKKNKKQPIHTQSMIVASAGGGRAADHAKQGPSMSMRPTTAADADADQTPHRRGALEAPSYRRQKSLPSVPQPQPSSSSSPTATATATATAIQTGPGSSPSGSPSKKPKYKPLPEIPGLQSSVVDPKSVSTEVKSPASPPVATPDSPSPSGSAAPASDDATADKTVSGQSSPSSSSSCESKPAFHGVHVVRFSPTLLQSQVVPEAYSADLSVEEVSAVMAYIQPKDRKKDFRPLPEAHYVGLVLTNPRHFLMLFRADPRGPIAPVHSFFQRSDEPICRMWLVDGLLSVDVIFGEAAAKKKPRLRSESDPLRGCQVQPASGTGTSDLVATMYGDSDSPCGLRLWAVNHTCSRAVPYRDLFAPAAGVRLTGFCVWSRRAVLVSLNFADLRFYFIGHAEVAKHTLSVPESIAAPSDISTLKIFAMVPLQALNLLLVVTKDRWVMVYDFGRKKQEEDGKVCLASYWRIAEDQNPMAVTVGMRGESPLLLVLADTGLLFVMNLMDGENVAHPKGMRMLHPKTVRAGDRVLSLEALSKAGFRSLAAIRNHVPPLLRSEAPEPARKLPEVVFVNNTKLNGSAAGSVKASEGWMIVIDFGVGGYQMLSPKVTITITGDQDDEVFVQFEMDSRGAKIAFTAFDGSLQTFKMGRLAEEIVFPLNQIRIMHHKVKEHKIRVRGGEKDAILYYATYEEHLPPRFSTGVRNVKVEMPSLPSQHSHQFHSLEDFSRAFVKGIRLYRDHNLDALPAVVCRHSCEVVADTFFVAMTTRTRVKVAQLVDRKCTTLRKKYFEPAFAVSAQYSQRDSGSTFSFLAVLDSRRWLRLYALPCLTLLSGGLIDTKHLRLHSHCRHMCVTSTGDRLLLAKKNHLVDVGILEPGDQICVRPPSLFVASLEAPVCQAKRRGRGWLKKAEKFFEGAEMRERDAGQVAEQLLEISDVDAVRRKNLGNTEAPLGNESEKLVTYEKQDLFLEAGDDDDDEGPDGQLLVAQRIRRDRERHEGKGADSERSVQSHIKTAVGELDDTLALVRILHSRVKERGDRLEELRDKSFSLLQAARSFEETTAAMKAKAKKPWWAFFF